VSLVRRLSSIKESSTMPNMDPIMIEVCPRSSGGYHASLRGDRNRWGGGTTIEQAVVGLVSVFPEMVGTAPGQVTAVMVARRPRLTLRNPFNAMGEPKPESMFLPCELR